MALPSDDGGEDHAEPAEHRDAAAIAAALPKLDGPATLAAARAAEMRALPFDHKRGTGPSRRWRRSTP